MKKLLILLSLSFSLAAYSQADPAFTAKMINAVNASVAYSQNKTPATLTSAVNAVIDFYPLTKSQFENKLSDMMGSPTEMAKFSTPITFVACVGQAATELWFCYWLSLPQDPQDIPPAPPSAPQQCATAYAQAVGQCAVIHL